MGVVEGLPWLLVSTAAMAIVASANFNSDHPKYVLMERKDGWISWQHNILVGTWVKCSHISVYWFKGPVQTCRQLRRTACWEMPITVTASENV
jgi:hypothetical protein